MSVSKDTLSLLSNDETSHALAVDALVELIQSRRKAGMSLYDVTITLIELMQRAHPSFDAAFDEARRLTYLPPHTDLTPGKGPLSLSSKSSSKAQVAAVLLRCPDEISLGKAREVLSEWAFAMEIKIQSASGTGDGVGRGGKGTIASSGYEDIATKFKEVTGVLVNPPAEVSALLLALRLQLSYLTLDELHNELKTLHLEDAETVLRQWVKRRLPGDGRYAVGKALDKLEFDVIRTRPALKSVIRVVKAKYLLPTRPVHQVQLPAPSKSRCIALLQGFHSSPPVSTSYSTGAGSSPTSPTIPLVRDPPPYISPSRPSKPGTNGSADKDDKAWSAFAMELLSEYLTRERREYMSKEKWIKSGRKALSKDMNEIEDKLCFAPSPSQEGAFKSRRTKSGGALAQNPSLIPIFDVLRRIYNLEQPPGQKAILTGSEYAPINIPDEDEPYFPPTPQTVTSALYCNPRLKVEPAIGVIMELVDYEKDLRIHAVTTMLTSRSADASSAEELNSPEGMIDLAWGTIEKKKMAKVLESIERRFPEGQYEQAFRTVEATTDCPPHSINRAPSYTTVASAKTSARTAAFMGAGGGSTPYKMFTSNATSPSAEMSPQTPLISRTASPYNLMEIAESVDEWVAGTTTDPVSPVVAETAPFPDFPLDLSSPTNIAMRSTELPHLDLGQLTLTAERSVENQGPDVQNPISYERPYEVSESPISGTGAPFTPTDMNRGYEPVIRPLHSTMASTETGMPIDPDPSSFGTRERAFSSSFGNNHNTPSPPKPSNRADTLHQSSPPPITPKAATFVKRRPSLFGRRGNPNSNNNAPPSTGLQASAAGQNVVFPRPAPRSASHSGLALGINQETPPAASSPLADTSTRGARHVPSPSLSPSDWRQQFMASNLLRPASSHRATASQGGTPSHNRTPMRECGLVQK